MNHSLDKALLIALMIAANGCGAGTSKEAPCPSTTETSELSKRGEMNQATIDKIENSGDVLEFSATPIQLPPARREGGMPLYQALDKRSSARDFAPDEIRIGILSQLLWAAVGVNRDDGRRTAPTAHNRQDLSVFVVTKVGLFEYDAQAHALNPIHDQDIRQAVGKQDFAREASLNLVYVSDLGAMGDTEPMAARTYAGAHAGAAAQNVYLFCASEGLSTVVRAYFDPEELGNAMKLEKNRVPILAQTVGLP